MMEMDFDTEKFIIEIQNRPPIWNTKCSEYSDRNLKQGAWEEVVNVYGAESTTEEKKKLGVTLQKKWRNIRDCFVKAHKAKETKSGSAAKKKVRYVFYNNLLFLKDTISVNTTTSNVTVNTEVNNDANEDAQNDTASNSSWTPQRKKKKDDDHIGRELIGVLNRNLENKNFEDDEDRLFFLSLVKEFKKIPEHLRIQTKLDLLKLIRDAQFLNYPNASGDYARPNNQYHGYQPPQHSRSHPYTHQTAQHSRTHPYTLPMQSSQVFGRVSPQATMVSPVQSPLSVESTATQESQDSQLSYIELFNSIPEDDM